MIPKKLVIKDAQIGYEESLVRSPISFELSSGKIYGLTGPSGGGKSTLLKTLAGFLPPVSGFIELDGKAVFQKDRLIWGHDHIAVLAQDFQLMEKHSAFERSGNSISGRVNSRSEVRIQPKGFVGHIPC